MPKDDPSPAGLRQPRGLYILALTEAWERFSYYGMSALLALYLVQQLLLPAHIGHVVGFAGFRRSLESLTGPLSTQALASQVFGFYSAFVYVTPILGGWIADRWLGARRTVMLGAVLLACGHLAMAFDQSFLAALLLLVLGTGCLKGNISAQVGALYPEHAAEPRTRGYLIFSVGISVGAMVGPVVCGLLAQLFGWHAGFGAAAAFMGVGLATYVIGLPYLPADAPRRAKQERVALTRSELRTVWALAAVVGITVFQTTAYNQSANVGLVWVAQHVNLATPFGRMPEPWFPSVDALTGIVAAPLLIALWKRQEARGAEPSPLTKIAIGAAIATLASLLLASGALQAGAGKASVVWPLLAFAAFGIGYMHYWPTCLALVSAASPERLKGTLMSLSFVGFFVGNLLVGYVGSTYEPLGPVRFWVMNAGIAAAGSIIALLARAALERALQVSVSPGSASNLPTGQQQHAG